MSATNGKTAKVRKVRGFMDGTDWSYEIGSASDGNKVYPSVRAIKRECDPCIGECGIVEVEVRFVRWVKKPTPPKAIKVRRK